VTYDFNPTEDTPTYRIGFTENGEEIRLKIDLEVAKEVRYLIDYLENIYKDI
jgi:hypothetical protein